MNKYFIYDLETTGLDFKVSGIYNLAGIMCNENGEILEELSILMNPITANKDISNQALEVGRVTTQDLEGYMPYNNGYNTLMTFLDKFINKYDKNDKCTLVGFNNFIFDDQFLRVFFTDNNNKYFGSYFNHVPRDTRILFAWELEDEIPIGTKISLNGVAEFLGIKFDEEKAHGALYDAKVTREIFLKLRELKNKRK